MDITRYALGAVLIGSTLLACQRGDPPAQSPEDPSKSSSYVSEASSSSPSAPPVPPQRPQARRLSFVPGKGVEGLFALGDSEDLFIREIGVDNLQARAVSSCLPCTFTWGTVIAYEDKAKRWIVLARKADKKIVQIFYCGEDWVTSSGFGPAVPFGPHAKDFGGRRNLRGYGLAPYGAGIGFRSKREIRTRDERGIELVDFTYECVTVFRPIVDIEIPLTDWNLM